MASTIINGKRSASIREQYTATKAGLALAQAELDRASRALAEGRVSAIITGKSLGPNVTAAVVELESKVANLSESLEPLEAAYLKVLASETAEEAEARSVAEAKQRQDYRVAVGVMIDAIIAAHKAAVTVRKLHEALPLSNVGNPVLQRASASVDFGAPEAMIAYMANLCQAGFSDLIPDEDPGKRRYLHQLKHDAERRAEGERQRLAQRKACGIDDPLAEGPAPILPDGGRKSYTFLGEIAVGQISA